MIVDSAKFFSVHLNNKADWSHNIDGLPNGIVELAGKFPGKSSAGCGCYSEVYAFLVSMEERHEFAVPDKGNR